MASPRVWNVNPGGGGVSQSQIDALFSRRPINAGDAPYNLSDSLTPTQQTAALVAAIDAAIAQWRDLWVPKGSYALNANINKLFADNRAFAMRCESGTRFDVTAAGGIPFQFGGTVGAPTAIGANAAKGDLTINVGSLSVVPGNVLFIKSSDLYNAARPVYYKGEIAVAVAVVGSVVTLDRRLFDSYLSATTTVAVMSAPHISVSGMEIAGAGQQNLMRIVNTRTAKVENVRAFGTRYIGINLENFLDAKVRDCYTELRNWVSGDSTNYGVGIGSGTKCVVDGGYYMGGRHGIAIGGELPTWNATVSNLVATTSPVGSGQEGLDAHGNCEMFIVDNCEAPTGYISSAKHNSIKSSRIYGGASSNIAVTLSVELPSSLDIVGSEIEAVGGTGAKAISVSSSSTGGAQPMGLMSFQKCRIKSTGSGISIDQNAVVGTSFKNLRVDQNVFDVANQAFICLGGASAPLWRNASFTRNEFRNTTTAEMIRINGATGSRDVVIEDNYFDIQNVVGYAFIEFQNMRDVYLTRNVFAGGRYAAFANSGTVYIQDLKVDPSIFVISTSSPVKRMRLENITTTIADASLFVFNAATLVDDARNPRRFVTAAGTLYASIEQVIENTASISLALPPTPRNGDTVPLRRNVSWVTNSVTVQRNGQTIEGASTDDTYNSDAQTRITYAFNGATWKKFFG